MAKIRYYILFLLIALAVVSCQETEQINDNGYLRVNVSTENIVIPQTKISDNYNPKQFSIRIVNASGAVVKETDDHTLWNNTSISLTPGNYTVEVSSNGFDGSESGFDIPYYTGKSTIYVESGKEKTANVTCTLANVKVTVNFDKSFTDAFLTAKSTVSSANSGVSPLEFVMGTTTKSGYFPVGDLTAVVSVTNKAGKPFSQTNTISNVKARDHYILNYKVAEHGSISDVTVSVDDTETIYTFTFNVSTSATTSLAVNSVSPWSTFAYVEGVIAASKETLDPSKMQFEYKLRNAEDWTSVPAIVSGNKFKATISGLSPETGYSCRMVWKGTDEYTSETVGFTTESSPVVPNMGFDDWFKSGRHQYACKEEDFDNKFWDSGNKGANTLSEVNPTRPETSDVVSGKAARLGSTTAASQFAAGSLFSGSFGSATITPLGAKLNFGQPFTGRPSALKGWFKYNPGSINKINTDKVTEVAKGDRDRCAIYIALADWTAPFEINTGENKFVDFSSSSIIAYGELPADKTSPESMSSYEEFNIKLKYRSLTRKPTYILIVCSSSKYGDYFTGSTSSVLLIDEFSFEYGEPTIDTDYIK